MTAALQRFKENDETEAKIIDVFEPTLTSITVSLDTFWEDAYSSYDFGDVLYDLNRDPLADVIPKEVYRQSFPALHQLFSRPGTFEFYLTVFRSIWGSNVGVTFAVPSPGVLNITIAALGVQTGELQAREIVSNVYVYSSLTDTIGGNQIMFQDKSGIKTEAEIDALMVELAPYGIIVDTTLTL